MTHALVDADTPAFAAAISCEDQEEWVAIARMDSSLHKIVAGCGCDTYQMYVSGGVNFRYGVDPLYKANRPDGDPRHREACKQHLISAWGAIETDGYEADDAVGCEQTENTMIVGIDKDLLMIPGKHYSWPITRGGKVVREEVHQTVSYIEGLRTFYTQVLTGDVNDNIGNYFDETSKTWKKEKYLLGKKKAEKRLEDCITETEMFAEVEEQYYQADKLDELEKNMDLLWIWRAYGETYSIRKTIYG